MLKFIPALLPQPYCITCSQIIMPRMLAESPGICDWGMEKLTKIWKFESLLLTNFIATLIHYPDTTTE